MDTRRWVTPTIVGVLFLCAWLFVTSFNIVGSYALPSPQSVLERLGRGISNGYLIDATKQTLLEALLGCVIATVIGVPVGFAIAHWRRVADAIEPYLAASQAIPAVAIAPLLVIWVGYGTFPIVVLCTIMVIFPIIIYTAVGVRSIDSEVVGAARLDGAGGIKLLRHIELPMAAPEILAGLRTGFTLSITGAVVGEMVIGGQKGLGILLTTAQHLNDSPGMFATIIVLAVTAISIYAALRFIENRAFAAVSAR